MKALALISCAVSSPANLAGEVFYDWAPDGLVVRLMAPSDRLLGNGG